VLVLYPRGAFTRLIEWATFAMKVTAKSSKTSWSFVIDDPCLGCSMFLARLARNANRSHASATGGMIFSLRLGT
jgi:hypothetical protein